MWIYEILLTIFLILVVALLAIGCIHSGSKEDEDWERVWKDYEDRHNDKRRNN